jgi:hypothetical protein
MAAIGLVMFAIGAVIFALAQRQIERALDELPEELSRKADERLGKINLGAVVIAVAVLVYLVARQLGHGRVGLYVCVALLVLNAVVVAFLRVRLLDALGPTPEVARKHRVGSFAQALGATIGFVGCGVYLLR